MMTPKRKSAIKEAVIACLEKVPDIVLPIDLDKIYKTHKIKKITYSELSETDEMKELLGRFDEEENDIVVPYGALCKYLGSKDGLVQRYRTRYIVFYSKTSSGPYGRLRDRFSLAHELGHIFLGHLQKGEKRLRERYRRDPLEEEADYFASLLLAPFPVLLKRGVRQPEELKEYCNVSRRASEVMFEHYKSWVWENHPVYPDPYDWKIHELFSRM